MNILDVIGLSKHFPSPGRRGTVYALNGVDLTLERGQTLGIVGESASGKSTFARTVLQLTKPTSGQVFFEGNDLTGLSPKALRACRRDMQMIFQDPVASLDARFTVERLLTEPLAIHNHLPKNERSDYIHELLDVVGLDADAAGRYPHEFSGGQRQRLNIARALALKPKLIIADEPVSALDVSIQSQILNLLTDMRKRFGLTYIIISHDLAVVNHIADQVAVMYLGRIVELAPTQSLFANPLHPYTKSLIEAVPQPKPGRKKGRRSLIGEPPNPENPPTGCAFHPRCPEAMDHCKTRAPIDVSLNSFDVPHTVRCHLYHDDQ